MEKSFILTDDCSKQKIIIIRCTVRFSPLKSVQNVITITCSLLLNTAHPTPVHQVQNIPHCNSSSLFLTLHMWNLIMECYTCQWWSYSLWWWWWWFRSVRSHFTSYLRHHSGSLNKGATADIAFVSTVKIVTERPFQNLVFLRSVWDTQTNVFFSLKGKP